jgi:hypothetical protein
MYMYMYIYIYIQIYINIFVFLHICNHVIIFVIDDKVAVTYLVEWYHTHSQLKMMAVDKNSCDYEIAATVCGFTPNLVDMFALKVVSPPPQLWSVRIVVLSGVDGNIFITIFAHAENQNKFNYAGNDLVMRHKKNHYVKVDRNDDLASLIEMADRNGNVDRVPFGNEGSVDQDFIDFEIERLASLQKAKLNEETIIAKDKQLKKEELDRAAAIAKDTQLKKDELDDLFRKRKLDNIECNDNNDNDNNFNDKKTDKNDKDRNNDDNNTNDDENSNHNDNNNKDDEYSIKNNNDNNDNGDDDDDDDDNNNNDDNVNDDYEIESCKIFVADVSKSIPFYENDSCKLYRGKFEGKDVAVKKVTDLSTNNLSTKREKSAASILKRNKDASESLNIQRIIFCYVDIDNDTFVICSLYCNGGSLVDLLSCPSKYDYSISQCLLVCIGILRGFAILHDIGMAHNDFKSSNCLITIDITTGEITPSICDFGCMDHVSPSSSDLSLRTVSLKTSKLELWGTATYRCPSRISNKTTDLKSDLYRYAYVHFFFFLYHDTLLFSLLIVLIYYLN